MVLITSLLLLLVVTILAIAMFRGVGLENRIAGNVMDKQRALQAATSTENYAEQWLVYNVTSTPPVICTPAMFTDTNTPMICNNLLALSTDALSPLVVPWNIGGSPVGYTYNPATGSTTTLFPVSATGAVDSFYEPPTVYIASLGSDATNPRNADYQIDAWSTGGSSGTVAVVESVYQISYTACAFPQCGL
ncbi:MAG: pilus assembly PilX family protein [Steroidobacteraceae bacterium]